MGVCTCTVASQYTTLACLACLAGVDVGAEGAQFRPLSDEVGSVGYPVLWGDLKTRPGLDWTGPSAHSRPDGWADRRTGWLDDWTSQTRLRNQIESNPRSWRQLNGASVWHVSVRLDMLRSSSRRLWPLICCSLAPMTLSSHPSRTSPKQVKGEWAYRRVYMSVRMCRGCVEGVTCRMSTCERPRGMYRLAFPQRQLGVRGKVR